MVGVVQVVLESILTVTLSFWRERLVVPPIASDSMVVWFPQGDPPPDHVGPLIGPDMIGGATLSDKM